MAKVISVNISEKKGTVKKPVNEGNAIENFGIEGDAHSGNWHRQISLLANESINKMKKPEGYVLAPGIFAENITTEGIELHTLPIDTFIKVGDAILQVKQIGKKCHKDCEIYKKIGNCIMPLEGIFAKVIKGGKIKVEDSIEIIEPIRVGVIISSDKGYSGERKDRVIPTIRNTLKDEIYIEIQEEKILPDEKEKLSKEMKRMADDLGVDLIITSGGTGFSPRDVMPEATIDVIDKNVPGISEYIRNYSLRYNLNAILSRGVSGIRNKTLIINLPGSPNAVKQCLECILPVLPHGINTLHGKTYECGSK